MKKIVPIGQKFNHFTILSVSHRGSHGETFVLCECSCGTKTTRPVSWVTTGAAKSCGCQRGNLVRASKLRHGYSRRGNKTPEYEVWNGIRKRCTNPKCKGYHNYGGRGISVAPEWEESFEAFIAHVGRRPTPKHTLDRIDNNGNYAPGNVRWALRRPQSLNQRRTLMVVHDGNLVPFMLACEKMGYVYGSILSWKKRSGISLQEAFDAYKARRRKPRTECISWNSILVICDGKEMPLKEACAIMGFDFETVSGYLRRTKCPAQHAFDRYPKRRKNPGRWAKQAHG